MSNTDTPCQQLGYELGDKFTMEGSTSVYVLQEDDNTSCPRFINTETGQSAYLFIESVTKINQPHVPEAVTLPGPDCYTENVITSSTPTPNSGTPTAPQFLSEAATLMEERGKTYDQADGERSAGKTVTAFNAITGKDLTEAEGWLFLSLLKRVRQHSQPAYHQDSAEDAVAYAALEAEALARGLANGTP